MDPTKLIATYARVSTARQEEEQTIQIQIGVLKEYAEKNGYSIVKGYVDDGWSGDMLARPALDEMRNDAKKKLWQAVLIYDPDRLARRYSYQELVMDELREAGIEIIFVTIPAPKNSEDKILHGVRGLFAEYERAKISERFRLGKLRKVKDGHILVNEAPYGYRYIRIQDGKPGYYEVNEEEARVVKKIFEWAAYERLSIRKIAMRLYGLGIKPRKNKRGVWDKSSISYLLRNPTYMGEAMWGRTVSTIPEKPKNSDKYRKMKKTSKRARPESEWIVVPVPAIIEKDLFQKVRDKLKENFAYSDRNRKHEYLLTGKIFCPCGKRRAGQGHTDRGYFFYRCTERLHSYPLPPTCTIKGINVKKVDPVVWDKIVELMSSPELMKEQIHRLIKDKKDDIQASMADITSLEKEVKKLKLQEDRYNKAYGAGLFTMEKLQEYIMPVRARIVNIESKILKSYEQGKNRVVMPTQAAIEAFASKSVRTLENLNFESRRAIVLDVIDKVIASPELIDVYGHIPINENVALCLNDGHGQDTNRHSGTVIPFCLSIKPQH